MEPTSVGESIALIVRLQQAADGQWCVHVEGQGSAETFPLVPATLIVNLWRSGDSRVLRGTIQLHGSRHCAAVQGNGQVVELVRAWLQTEDTDLKTG